MKRFIFWVRLSGYISGLLGLTAMLAARRVPLTVEQRNLGRGIGAALLLAMFLCFLTGYILHTVRTLRQRSGERPRSPDRSL